MPGTIKVERHSLRSLGQISRTRETDEAVACQLRDARRAARAIAGEIESIGLAGAFQGSSSVRVREKSITIFAGSAAVKAKLSQILPRLSERTAAAGFLQPLKLVIRPRYPSPRRKPAPAAGVPRSAPPQTVADMRTAAGKVRNPGLRRALLDLADSLEEPGQ